jgi:hypothetical protein
LWHETPGLYLTYTMVYEVDLEINKIPIGYLGKLDVVELWCKSDG